MSLTNLILDSIIAKMSDKLDSDQLTYLEASLIVSLRGLKIEKESTELSLSVRGWDYYLPRFRASKRLRNCAESTIQQYDFAINKLQEYVHKNPQDILENDIKYFLAMYGEYTNPVTGKKPSKTYINNLKNDLGAFFSWMTDSGYISRNPVKNVPNIKVPKAMRKAYSGEDMELLKENAKNVRDKALIYFLDSTGVRIGEALSIDRTDIDWNSRSIIFYGSKGKAERQVFFTEECAHWLKEYLQKRTDTDPALFVSINKPHTRLTVSGAEYIIRNIGKKIGIHAHPHRFRRTMITRNARRGMNLQEIQMLAGHANSQTTQIYIDMQRENLRASYVRCS